MQLYRKRALVKYIKRRRESIHTHVLYIELEQFLLFTLISAVKACIWNIMPDKTLHAMGKFVFPHHKCYVLQNFYMLENSTGFYFRGSISIFGYVCAELQSLK